MNRIASMYKPHHTLGPRFLDPSVSDEIPFSLCLFLSRFVCSRYSLSAFYSLYRIGLLYILASIFNIYIYIYASFFLLYFLHFFLIFKYVFKRDPSHGTAECSPARSFRHAFITSSDFRSVSDQFRVFEISSNQCQRDWATRSTLLSTFFFALSTFLNKRRTLRSVRPPGAREPSAYVIHIYLRYVDYIYKSYILNADTLCRYSLPFSSSSFFLGVLYFNKTKNKNILNQTQTVFYKSYRKTYLNKITGKKLYSVQVSYEE